MSYSRLLLSALVSAVTSLALAAGVASAHVSVLPAEAPAGANQSYTVRVPSEKETPTVKVRVEFPPEVVVSRFMPKTGWTREVEKDSAGKIVAATWSGGKVASDEYEEFGFIARNPRDTGSVTFKAFQTYGDGETVAWVNAAGQERPASVTTITAATAASSGGSIEQPGQAAAGAATGAPAGAPAAGGGTAPTVTSGRGTSDLGLFIALGAAGLALVGIALAAVSLARRPRPAQA